MSIFQKSVNRYENDKNLQEEKLKQLFDMEKAVEVFQNTHLKHKEDLINALNKKSEFHLSSYKFEKHKLEVTEKHEKGDSGKHQFIFEIDMKNRKFRYQKLGIKYGYVKTTGNIYETSPNLIEEKVHDISHSNEEEIQKLTEKYLVKMVDDVLKI